MTGETQHDMNERSPGGVIAFCDYLTDKGHATNSQVNPWKIALRKVFQAVEREEWESCDLSAIDVEEYLDRFQKLAGAQYKVDSITAYKRRIQNALDATGSTSTRAGRRRSGRDSRGPRPRPRTRGPAQTVTPLSSKSAAENGFHSFTYPLGDGRVAKFELPPRMKADDVIRITGFHPHPAGRLAGAEAAGSRQW